MNKLERKQLIQKKETRTNNLWIGMVTGTSEPSMKKRTDQTNAHHKPLSYRMKVYERDNLKLERDE